MNILTLTFLAANLVPFSSSLDQAQQEPTGTGYNIQSGSTTVIIEGYSQPGEVHTYDIETGETTVWEVDPPNRSNFEHKD